MIEELCEEFHNKIGREKTVKITILEGDTENWEGWFTGTMDSEVLEKIIKQPRTKEPKSFLKLSKGNGIEYSYFGSSKSTDK